MGTYLVIECARLKAVEARLALRVALWKFGSQLGDEDVGQGRAKQVDASV